MRAKQMLLFLALLALFYLELLFRNIHPYTNLGVFVDSELKFAKQVNTVVKTSL